MALTAYNSPGVTVTESVNPALAPLLANPSVVALVGPSTGYQTASERIVLTGTSPVTLRYTGVNQSSVLVQSSVDGSTIGAGNYVITQGADPNSSVTGDEPYTIARATLPATGPTVAAGVGTLTGTYHYAVAFVNASGQTGIGPRSSDITVTAQGVNLSAIATGPTGTTSRAIYREKVISGVGQGYHLVATINDNTTTVLTNETTSDTTAGNAASPLAGIADGDTVVVTYNYTDQNYYAPTTMDSFDAITAKYGSPYDSNGNINSALSFAARLLFLNGASELILVGTPTGSEADIDAGLAQLENLPEVRFVSVAAGSSAINNDVIAHVNKMNAQGYFRMAVLGIDGSATAVGTASQRTSAQAINEEAIMLVNSTSFQMQNPVTGRTLNVGGQYAAAAITGMWAGRDVQFPLTRKTVAGFVDINDKRTASDEALDSAAGLLVISNRGGVLQVRHSLTTAVGSISTREGSVVRAKYDMAHRMKDVLDSAVVGIVVPINRAPLIAQSVVVGLLEQLILEGSIQSYSNVSARVLDNDPTTVEVRYSYLPAFPINNISVIYTIDTTTGDFTSA